MGVDRAVLLRGECIPNVAGDVAPVGDPVAMVGRAVPLGGRGVALVGEVVALSGSGVAQVGLPFPLVAGVLPVRV